MSADPKSMAALAIVTTTKDPSIDSWHNFVAGLSAAVINTSVLFPVNKLIFRQMSGGLRPHFAISQLCDEGFKYLYRGILPPLIQKTVSVSIMFSSFKYYKNLADTKLDSCPYVVNLTIAACLTGTTEAIFTPLERVQMLLQVRRFHKQYHNTFDALVKLRVFGIKEYYRGLTCVLMRNGPSNILFFGLKDEVKTMLPHIPANQKTFFTNTLYDFLSGATLGMFISTLFYPLSVVRTKMQTRAPGAKYLSMIQAFNSVYNERERKFSRLFHGCTINVIRQFASWGIINCAYEFFLQKLSSY